MSVGRTTEIPSPGPRELLPGLPVEPVADLVDAVRGLARSIGKPILPGMDGASIEALAGVTPLLTEHARQGGTPVTPEEITGPVMESVLSISNKVAVRGLRLAVKARGEGGFLGRTAAKIAANTINEKLSEPKTATFADVALGVIGVAEKYPNPRKQFDDELVWASHHVWGTAYAAARERAPQEPHITTDDYAAGVVSLMGLVLREQPAGAEKGALPMLREMVTTVLSTLGKKIKVTEQWKIAVVSQELAEAIDSSISDPRLRRPDLVQAMRQHSGHKGGAKAGAMGQYTGSNPKTAVEIQMPILLGAIRQILTKRPEELGPTRTWIEQVLKREGRD